MVAEKEGVQLTLESGVVGKDISQSWSRQLASRMRSSLASGKGPDWRSSHQATGHKKSEAEHSLQVLDVVFSLNDFLLKVLVPSV